MVFDFFASFLNLEQEALIILECCSTGRKTASGQENVAQELFLNLELGLSTIIAFAKTK